MLNIKSSELKAISDAKKTLGLVGLNLVGMYK